MTSQLGLQRPNLCEAYLRRRYDVACLLVWFCNDSPDWIKKKKATINPKYKDNKWSSYGEIESHPERVSNIVSFLNKYKCKGMTYPSELDYWKTFEKNNREIAHNILYIKKYIYIYPAYIPKFIRICEKQIILVLIPKESKKARIILQ